MNDVVCAVAAELRSIRCASAATEARTRAASSRSAVSTCTSHVLAIASNVPSQPSEVATRRAVGAEPASLPAKFVADLGDDRRHVGRKIEPPK